MSRVRKGKDDSLYYYKWLDKALSDLQTARLIKMYEGDYFAVAFHCQQAIEKALKGWLLFKSGRHFDGHNLTYLCRQSTLIDNNFSKYLDESAALNGYYIETRYPTDLSISISEKDVLSVLCMAEDIFAYIRKDIYKEDGPAPIRRYHNIQL